MKRRLILNIFTLLLVLAFALPAAAAEVTEPVTRAENQCGEDMTWSYEDGTLTISGTGEMDDFPDGAPWDVHRDEITEVVIEDGVTYIGQGAFKDYDALESVDFGDSLYEIGKEAFWSCEGLTSITLPASFKVFGESSFLSCKNMTEIYCQGKFPSFRQNSMWDTYATIYYPADRPWNVESIQQLETAFKGRIEFIASDGTDHYEPTEPEEVTEPTEIPEETEPETLPPETEPETQPATEPEVTETEPVETEAPTEAPTEPEEETMAPTEPAQQEDGPNGTLIFLVLLGVGVALTLIVVLALIIKGNSRKGKFSA